MSTHLTAKQLSAARSELTRLQASLAQRVKTFQEGVLDPSGDSEGQRADEGGDDAAFERERSTLAAEELLAEQVRDALLRVAAGTYGICTACQRNIERERLDLVPYASTCMACARVHDSHARA